MRKNEGIPQTISRIASPSILSPKNAHIKRERPTLKTENKVEDEQVFCSEALKRKDNPHCSSNPNLSHIGGYIKLKPDVCKKTHINIEDIVEKEKKNQPFKKFRNSGTKNEVQTNVFDGDEKFNEESKYPRFSRKMFDPFSPKNSRAISTLVQEKPKNALQQENTKLKKVIEELSKKIKQIQKNQKSLKIKNLLLENKVKSYEEKIKSLEQRNNDLSLHIQFIQNQKCQLTEKLQNLMNEHGIFKGSSQSFHFDIENNIELQLASTTENIYTCGEIEDEIFRKDQQNFELKQVLEKLQIQSHFSELRNCEKLKKCNENWENKYKSLLQNYKSIKSQLDERNQCPKKNMKKMDHSICQDFFNLSLSTELMTEMMS